MRDSNITLCSYFWKMGYQNSAISKKNNGMQIEKNMEH